MGEVQVVLQSLSQVKMSGKRSVIIFILRWYSVGTVQVHQYCVGFSRYVNQKNIQNSFLPVTFP